MTDVVTGEAVALDLRIAQLPSRLTAGLLDLLTMVVGYLAVAAPLLAGLDAVGLDSAFESGIEVVLLLAAFLGYPVIMETLTRGRTLGKLALGLRVVRDDGGPITFRQALVRGLVGLAIERPGLFLLGLGPALGMLVSMLSARGKRIGDMAAGTIVVQERTPARPTWMPVMPPPLAWWAPALDLTGLDDELALTVRQFLGRAFELTADAREALAADLVTEVRARTRPEPPPGTPGWAYLSAVLAERRRRDEERAARAVAMSGAPPGGYGRPGFAARPAPGWYAGSGNAGGPPPGWYAGPGYAGGPSPGWYAGPGYAGGPPPGWYGGPAPGVTPSGDATEAGSG